MKYIYIILFSFISMYSVAQQSYSVLPQKYLFGYDEVVFFHPDDLVHIDADQIREYMQDHYVFEDAEKMDCINCVYLYDHIRMMDREDMIRLCLTWWNMESVYIAHIINDRGSNMRLEFELKRNAP